MIPSEFDVIESYFAHLSDWAGEHVRVGVGDDCALLDVGSGFELVVSTDTFVEGVHFPNGAPGPLVAERSLAAAASDLAAMGAEPLAVVGALILRDIDSEWLESFSERLGELLRVNGLPLVGGNLTQGPHFSLTWTVMGRAKAGEALTRSGAEVGQDVYVSGWIGRAASGLDLILQTDNEGEARSIEWKDAASVAKAAYSAPKARLALGQKLIGVASAAIDISDGLLSDLGHLLTMSGVGAEIDASALLMDKVLETLHGADGEILRRALAGGDDYELCFCVDEAKRVMVEAIALELQLPLTRIGRISEAKGVRFHSLPEGVLASDLLKVKGYEHFA
jgi:thiamine-monophosphate kinase